MDIPDQTPEASVNPSPRIGLIGPLQPYRGGIAHYTTQLRHALGKRAALYTCSFSRQYPSWLYPGATDKEQGSQWIDSFDVAYSLDAINPITWYLTARLLVQKQCEFVVISWWTIFWAPCFSFITWILRRRGVKVAFLCHNLADHDSSPLKRGISNLLLKSANLYIVHSVEQAASMRRMFPQKTVLQHPHPIYDHFPKPSRNLPPRGRLELLFFGFIRPYKGLDLLIAALSELHDASVHLTVIGEPWINPEQLRDQVKASGAPNVELHLEYMSDAVAADYFARADLVVLPYRSATGSGVAAVAYHYGCPLIVSDVGGLRDVVVNGETGFILPTEDVTALVDCLRGVNREALVEMRKHVQLYKNKLSWSSMAETILDSASKKLF